MKKDNTIMNFLAYLTTAGCGFVIGTMLSNINWSWAFLFIPVCTLLGYILGHYLFSHNAEFLLFKAKKQLGEKKEVQQNG